MDLELTHSVDLSDRKPVTLVIPCFNEAAGVEHFAYVIERLEAALYEYEFRYVIVDDGSTDGTALLLQQAFEGRDDVLIVRHRENQGIAAALMTGFGFADTEPVCSMDFDCTYDPIHLRELIEPLDWGFDLVTASPYHPEGRVLNVPQWRLAISRCAALAYSLCMRPKLHTYTSCFRAYRRDAVQNLRLANPGFAGIAEMLWQVDLRGGKMAEVPATLDVRRFGQSKMRVVQVTGNHVRLLASILLQRLLPKTVSQKINAGAMPDGKDNLYLVSTHHVQPISELRDSQGESSRKHETSVRSRL